MGGTVPASRLKDMDVTNDSLLTTDRRTDGTPLWSLGQSPTHTLDRDEIKHIESRAHSSEQQTSHVFSMG
jgi:hypothetical protein